MFLAIYYQPNILEKGKYIFFYLNVYKMSLPQKLPGKIFLKIKN